MAKTFEAKLKMSAKDETEFKDKLTALLKINEKLTTKELVALARACENPITVAKAKLALNLS